MINRFFIYGGIGLCIEVFWTGLCGFFEGDFTFTGHSSLVMFPIYGSVVFLEPLFKELRYNNIFLRGVVYMLLIFSTEYFSGIFLNSFGICPWSYAEAKYNINGVVRIDYMPLWFGVGIMYERIYKFFK
ncbi:MAG: hypothetical protein V8S74_07430 [Lachnospirales bacterium]